MLDNTSTKPHSLDVVLYTPTLDGGVGRVTALLAKGIHARGIAVEVWSTAHGGDYSADLEQIVKVQTLGTGSVSSSLFPLLRALRKHEPKTIISATFHANCIAVLASLFVARKQKTIIVDHPSVDTALKELSLLKRIVWKALIRLLYPRADTHIAISQGVAQAMAKYGGVPQQQIHIIPNPVISDELFSKSSEPVTHPFFDTNEPVLLYVGRLSPEKDLSTLLRAFALLQEKTLTRLLLVGDGPERENLERIVADQKLQDRVSFLGHQANPYPYFTKSDVFVLSSTREGLPTVLIEALALGVKVVSTDCPSGPREVLNGGKYGILVPAGDTSSLSEAMTMAVTSPRTEIPKEALAQYQIDNVVDSYIKVLKLGASD